MTRAKPVLFFSLLSLLAGAECLDLELSRDIEAILALPYYNSCTPAELTTFRFALNQEIGRVAPLLSQTVKDTPAATTLHAKLGHLRSVLLTLQMATAEQPGQRKAGFPPGTLPFRD